MKTARLYKLYLLPDYAVKLGHATGIPLEITYSVHECATICSIFSGTFWPWEKNDSIHNYNQPSSEEVTVKFLPKNAPLHVIGYTCADLARTKNAMLSVESVSNSVADIVVDLSWLDTYPDCGRAERIDLEYFASTGLRGYMTYILSSQYMTDLRIRGIPYERGVAVKYRVVCRRFPSNSTRTLAFSGEISTGT